MTKHAIKAMIRCAVVLGLTLALLAGCKQKEPAQPSAQPGQVVVTPAYERYFGAAPPYDKGTAYGFVIYFPSSKEPGKVVPFPFYTFDEKSIKKVALERLLSGMEVGSYRGEFAPFPSGSRLIALGEEQGTVSADFSKELETAPKSVATALALTLRQFQGVTAVRLLVEGKESALNPVVQKADETAVRQSPPRLLSVTAMRDKGAKDIEEVNAYFDRPVTVKELSLLSEGGEQFPGEIYHSVFDMAVVLKPKDPSQFKKDMPVRVRWKVADKLGRQAEGDSVWPLEIREH